MATTEKILNTRIQLKYDKYETWVEKNPTLKSGELAIAYLSTSHTTTSPDNGTHAVMFKVGPGAFNSLPWASALAADVYSWAKQSENDFVANFLGMKDSSGATMQAKLDGLFTTPDEVSSAVAALKSELTNDSTGILANAKAYAEQVAGTAKDDAIAAAATDASTKAATAKSEAIAAAKEYTDGRETAITTAYQTYADQAEADALAAAKTYAEDEADAAEAAAKSHAEAKASAAETAAKLYADGVASTAKSEAIAEAATDASTKADKALEDANKYTDAEIDKVEASIEDIIDGTTPVAKATKADDADKLGGIVAADYATKEYADQAEADALSEAKKYADEVKKAILTGDSTAELKEAYDTLVEIQQWIEGDGVNATELTKAIADEADLRQKADKAIQDQIDALGITDGKVASAKKADEASSLDASGVAQVQGIKVNNAGTADVAAKASGLDSAGEAAVKLVKVDNATHADDADKLGGVVAANYALKTDAQGYANTAEQNAKDYADGLAGNYATAEQGAKADSAVQTVVGDTGLQATKSGTEVTIGFDPDVVFVFNCGSATEFVD